METPVPDYYSLLHVPLTATSDEIKRAYKKESLRTHPDRLVNATTAEKKAATAKFQEVSDAYYVLSDPARRKQYDLLWKDKSRKNNNSTGTSENFFSQFGGMFGGGAGKGQPNMARPDADDVFGDVFEELLRPEVHRRMPVWSYAGAVCGGGLGFIIANLPGLMIGAVAGNRLGAIRDAKGKSVAAVFADLGGNEKAAILRALAAKVLGSAL